MADKLGYDPPKLTRDEATELCVYHLRTAAALFQLVPDDDNVSLLAEIHRQTGEDSILEVDRQPMLVWACAIWRAYDSMKDKD